MLDKLEENEINSKKMNCYLCEHSGCSHDLCATHEELYKEQDYLERLSYFFNTAFILLQHSFTLLHAIMKMGGIFTVTNNVKDHKIDSYGGSKYLISSDLCMGLFQDVYSVSYDGYKRRSGCNCVSQPFNDGGATIMPIYDSDFDRSVAWIAPAVNQHKYDRAKENVNYYINIENYFTLTLLSMLLLYGLLSSVIYMNKSLIERVTVQLWKCFSLLFLYIGRQYLIIMPLENAFCEMYVYGNLQNVSLGVNPLQPFFDDLSTGYVNATFFNLSHGESGRFSFFLNDISFALFFFLIDIYCIEPSIYNYYSGMDRVYSEGCILRSPINNLRRSLSNAINCASSYCFRTNAGVRLFNNDNKHELLYDSIATSYGTAEASDNSSGDFRQT